MKILKFTLSGRNAFFKKPDVNALVYYTYGNIHKVALLGMFGAILGYNGYNAMKAYNQNNKKDLMEYPEFYQKLKDLQVSIAPNNYGFFEKKVQFFNNSVGYASQEQGGNLIVKEQWLEYPSWDIYVQVDSEVSEKLADYMLNRRAVYIPYLGKNDHIANIDNVRLFKDDEIEILNECSNIDSLFKENMFRITSYGEGSGTDDIEKNAKNIGPFKYQERLPLALEKQTNLYITQKLIFTNFKLTKNSDVEIFNVDDRKVVFY